MTRTWGPAVTVELLCKAHHLPEPQSEYQFHPTRRWRLDKVWLPQMVALEIEGGVWTGGRHTRGAGYVKDIEKYNAAQLAGWVVLRCTPDQVQSGAVAELLREALA